jgi:CRP-like cAMP-binding protein
MSATMNLDALRCCPLFYDLDDRALGAILPLMVERQVAKGQHLFREGEAGDGFYVVLQGAVRLQKLLGNGEVAVVAELGAGDVFGEMSLLTSAPRTAGAVVTSDARFWLLSQRAFEELQAQSLEVYAAVVKNLGGLLCHRLAQATRKVAGLLKDLQDAEGRKEGIQRTLEKSRAGLLGFIGSLGGGRT